MGCRVCRARKVKCDGRPNGCRNCERLQLECVSESGVIAATANMASVAAPADNGAHHHPTAASGSTSPTSLRKIRTYRSCTACRLSKTKCDGGRPNCARCVVKKLSCVYDGGSSPRWTRNLNRDAAGSGGSGGGGAVNSLDTTIAVDGIADRGSRDGTSMSGTTLDDADGASPGGSHNSAAAPSEIPAPPLTRSGIADTPDILAWLLAPQLPSPRHVRRLVEHYFANIHPIRCFAFVHKPSFMRQLDSGFVNDDEVALLHIICAHGAKFHCLSLNQFDQQPNTPFIRAAGNQWAKRAESLLLQDYGKPSTQKLMTAVLLFDFHYRLGEFGQALMLSGLAVRMAQALRINTEYSRDILGTEPSPHTPSVVARESRRRLMWSVYALDAWTGRGVEQLTLLRASDIKIQLPCNERNFGLRIASVTETLGVGHVLQFLPPSAVPARPADNMGIMACYIRIVTLWRRIVAYVNRGSQGHGGGGAVELQSPPWMPESEFAALDADMARWRRELPDFVEYSPDTIYARLDSNQLGALVLIHCTYHHSYLELYKVSMPELFRPAHGSPGSASSSSSVDAHPPPMRMASSVGGGGGGGGGGGSNGSRSSSAVFPPEHVELLQALQAECYFHALQVTRLLSEAAEQGTRLLSDSVLPFFVYDSSRVMLYYVARLLDPARVDFHDKVAEALRAVEVNAGLLRIMAPLFPVSESLLATVERWLFKARQSSGGSLIRGIHQSEDVNSIPSVEMTSTIGSPASGSHDASIPPFSMPTDTTTDSPPSERAPPSRGTSWAAANTASSSPHANDPDQHPSGKQQHQQQQETLAASQHERPVPKPVSMTGAGPAMPSLATPGAASNRGGGGGGNGGGSWWSSGQRDGSVGVSGALDLDELQSFLSWDIYGVMDLEEAISASAGPEEDEVRRSEWASMIY